MPRVSGDGETSSGRPDTQSGARAGPSYNVDGVKQEALGLFECNICYDLAREPVITRCGHLYCWACFYKWMQTRPHCKTCPVCKAGTSEDKVTPIYGRGREPVDPRKSRAPSESREEEQPEVPQRPPGHRAPAVNRGALVVADPMLHGHGALHSFSALFGLHSSSHSAEPITQEQRSQAFVSKILLMLGSFVIMCLLLF